MITPADAYRLKTIIEDLIVTGDLQLVDLGEAQEIVEDLFTSLAKDLPGWDGQEWAKECL